MALRVGGDTRSATFETQSEFFRKESTKMVSKTNTPVLNRNLVGGILVAAAVISGPWLFKRCLTVKKLGVTPTSQQDQIIFRTPVIKYKTVGDVHSETEISGYSEQLVRTNQEFIIDPANLIDPAASPSRTAGDFGG